jgi:hypothetical protein
MMQRRQDRDAYNDSGPLGCTTEGRILAQRQVGRASVICRATPSAVGVVSPRAEMVAVLGNSWISSANSATEATGSTRSWLPPPFNLETG